MNKLKSTVISCCVGIPGMLVGFALAHSHIEVLIASQLDHRRWIDSTGLDTTYATYGLVGYFTSMVAGELILRFLRSRKYRVGN